jgi:Predicted membrane protein (DUF2339)
LKVSSFAAAACAVLGIWVLVPGWTLVLLWALLALVLVEVGLWARSVMLRLQGYGVLAVAVFRLVAVNFAETHVSGWHDVRLWAGVAVVVACVLVHERLRRVGESVAVEERVGIAGAAMWCASGVAAWVLYLELPERWLAVGWAVLALVLVEYGLRVRSLSVRLQGYGVLAGSLCWLVIVNFQATGKAGWHDVRLWAGVALVAACVLVHERLGREGEIVLAEERTGVAGAVMWCASALVTGLLYMELPERWLAAGWAAFALLLAGFALVRDGARIRRKALLLALLAAGQGIFLNLGSAGNWWYSSGTMTVGAGTTWGTDWGRLAFFVAMGLLVIAIPVGFVLRRRELAGGGGALGRVLRRPEQVFFFAVLAMLFVWMPVDFHRGALTMAWSGLGVAIFLVALEVGERSFRLSGLGVLLFGVVKLLAVDVWGLPSVERYLLLIGVGVALLLVSFLYSRFGDRLKEYL